MAEGILSLNGAVDYVFSGECEISFPEFLKAASAGKLPETRIVAGEPCFDLDSIPTSDFTQFYEQLKCYLPNSDLVETNNIWLPYEGSRGCWWGEKHHCTFCGINGSTMKFREKSPDKVIAELRVQLSKHPTRKVCMVDNIMPHSYFRTLIPRLNEEVPGVHMFYEQKANLSLDQVVALRQSGVAVIQPGIEALSTSLLKRMDKGVSARQNIALLRYARAADLGINWNLLYAFPGDTLEEYQQTLALVRLLRHLNPPDGPCHLSIDRFSPYFFAPEKYGVTNLRPMASYNSVLPSHADVNKIAYHFMGDYKSGSVENPALIKEIAEELNRWRAVWNDLEKPLPVLAVSPISDENYLLFDSRGLEGTEEIQFLTRSQAALVLVGTRVGSEADVQWAMDGKLLVELDGWYVPLATASPQLMNEFEAESRPFRASITKAVLPVVNSHDTTHS
jgi:ribosomal peptide maturation radical SAM protein 1